jgi:hypothetical protein
VVVEAAFADALGVDAGDPITLNGRSLRVVGVAVTAATTPYPDGPALPSAPVPPAWSASPRRMRSLAAHEEYLVYVLNLKLVDQRVVVREPDAVANTATGGRGKFSRRRAAHPRDGVRWSLMDWPAG